MKVFAFSIPTSKGTKTLNMKCLRKRKCNHKLGAWFFTTLHYNTPKSKRTEKKLSPTIKKIMSKNLANFRQILLTSITIKKYSWENISSLDELFT